MKALYFDCFSGASGDMIMGALIDAGASFDAIQAGLASLPVHGYHLHAEKVMKHGIQATRFHVHMEHTHTHDHDHDEHEHVHSHVHLHEDHPHDHEHKHADDPTHDHPTHDHVHGHEHSHDDHDHAHTHPHPHGHHVYEQGHQAQPEGHHPHQPQRHLGDILALLEASSLPQQVIQAASETFRRIAVCEAAIHGTTVEEIHFHEVGAVDSIIDIVGAHLALHLLGIETCYASPLHVGYGTVKAAHGVMPVPAPATAALLKGVPTYGGDVQGELVTPTGAALITQLTQTFGPMPMMRSTGIGYGAGMKDLADRANVLRVVIGEIEVKPHTHPITVVETSVDDMNPELLPPMVSALLEAGARDAFLTPILGKKGRPAYLITVLCDGAKLETISGLLFEHTRTFGVRFHTEHRICLDREWKIAHTSFGPVQVKMGRLNGQVTSASPEYEDCHQKAVAAGVSTRTVYEAALALAIQGDLHDV